MIKIQTQSTPLAVQLKNLTHGREHADKLPSDMTEVRSTPLMELNNSEAPNKVGISLVILYEWEIGIREYYKLSNYSLISSLIITDE